MELLNLKSPKYIQNRTDQLPFYSVKQCYTVVGVTLYVVVTYPLGIKGLKIASVLYKMTINNGI